MRSPVLNLLPPVLLVLLLVCGSTTTTAKAQSPDAQLLADLTRLEKDSWEAMKRSDREFFRTYMTADFRGFFADGTTADRDAFLRNLDDFSLSEYSMGDVSLLRVNADAVMILYRLSYHGLHKGRPVKLSNIESSSLYVRRGGKWLEIFYQETVVPAP